MKKQTIWVLTTLMFIFFTFSAQAGTRDDCITKCKEAVQFYQKWGKDATIKEIGDKTGKFVWNDGVSYVFMMDMDAMMMAHPGLSIAWHFGQLYSQLMLTSLDLRRPRLKTRSRKLNYRDKLITNFQLGQYLAAAINGE